METSSGVSSRFSSEYLSTVRDLTSGTIGGMLGIFVGQPLDRVKVLSQTAAFTSTPVLPSSMPSAAAAASPSAVRTGTLATLMLLTRREGLMSLWKGVASPMVGAAPLNALAFAGNGKSLRYLDIYFPQSPSSSSSEFRPYLHYFLSGCVGGFAQTVAATPAELVKCKLQIQLTDRHAKPSPSSAAVPTNAYAMVRQIYHTEGPRGLMRGFTITALRDIPSYGVYFLTYEYTKDTLLALRAPSRSVSPGAQTPLLFSSPVVPMLLSGAVAGLVSWLQCYPVDVVKSVIQTGGGNEGMWAVTRRMYAAGGWRCFFRGLSPTLLRSVPVNAVTFLVYEHVQLLWDRLLPS